VPIVLKSGSLDLLEPSGPVQVCYGIVLPFYSVTIGHLHRMLQNENWWELCELLHWEIASCPTGLVTGCKTIWCHNEGEQNMSHWWYFVPRMRKWLKNWENTVLLKFHNFGTSWNVVVVCELRMVFCVVHAQCMEETRNSYQTLDVNHKGNNTCNTTMWGLYVKVLVFQEVTPCNMVDRYQWFWGTCCLHFQGRRARASKLFVLVYKTKSCHTEKCLGWKTPFTHWWWGAGCVVEHCGQLKEEKNILPLLGIQLQFHGRLACWLVIILTIPPEFVILVINQLNAQILVL